MKEFVFLLTVVALLLLVGCDASDVSKQNDSKSFSTLETIDSAGESSAHGADSDSTEEPPTDNSNNSSVENPQSQKTSQELYDDAMIMLEEGNYLGAYINLKLCKGFENSEELLDNFVSIHNGYVYTELTHDGSLISVCKYDKYGNQIYKVYYSNDNNVLDLSAIPYEYVENGNKILYIYYNKDGKESGRTEFDKFGNPTLEISYDADGNLLRKIERESDDKGNIISSKSCETAITAAWNHKYEYKYDEHGNITLGIGKDEEGNIFEKNEYDKNGNIISSTAFFPEGSVIDKYEYDEKGNKISEVSYSITGKIVDIIKYEYDEYNNEILCAGYDENGNLKWKNIWEHTYDEYDNIVLSLKYDENGNLDYTGKYEYNNPTILYIPQE